jgi:hypothetical protein
MSRKSVKKVSAEINQILSRKLMNATEMKKILQAYSETLDDKNMDEFYGTVRDEWENLWPGFLMWYNSHHNRVIAKLAKDEPVQ